MIIQEKNASSVIKNIVTAVSDDQALTEADVLVLLVTKEDIEDINLPYVELLRKLMEKDKKICNLYNVCNF